VRQPGVGRDPRLAVTLTVSLARLTESQVPGLLTGRFDAGKGERVRTVKKLLLLALVGLGVAAAWRKVQADRAELDLWTEATTSDD
jgi:hypothetical protein